MIFLVPSVHHTGTKTVYNSVLKDYEGINQQDPHPPETGKIRIHIDEPFLEDLDYWLDRSTTIVPIRHPRAVAQGWKNRVKPLELLEKQWNWLKEFVHPRVDFYIPVDRIYGRAKALRKINGALGLNLETHWPVLGRHEGETIDLTREDEVRLQSWMQDGFFRKFGYE